MAMQERARVGAAQVAPQFFDKRKTLQKTVGSIEEAGRLAYRYGVRAEDLEAYLARGLDHAE
jgi:hypothetical protein